MRDESASKQIDKSVLEEFNFLQKTGALDNLALLRNENRALDSLLNDAAKIYTFRSIEEILTYVIERALQRFIPRYLLVVIEPPRGELRQYCYANLRPSTERIEAPVYAALKEKFRASPYPADFEATTLDGAVRTELERFDPDILIPLSGLEGVYGIAVLGRKVVGDTYSALERMYIDKLTRFISIAIQNNLHHQSSITDAKTGLFNNSYFMQRLNQEISHVSRHRTDAGVIMLDVDFFKKFNDTWGHLAGDEALSCLAAVLRETVRSEDVAARFGGEEFCVLGIECDAPGIFQMSERIRRAVEAMVIPFKDEKLSVTVSLGCCVLDPDMNVSPQHYLDMADRALYRSKKGGRNRSTFYRPGLYGRASAFRGIAS